MQQMGFVIKKYRKKAGILSTELARKIGVSQGTISHIETGKRQPSDELLKKIQQELEIPQEIIDRSKSLSNNNNIAKNIINNIKFDIGDDHFFLSLMSENSISKTPIKELQISALKKSIYNILKTNQEVIIHDTESRIQSVLDNLKRSNKEMKIQWINE